MEKIRRGEPDECWIWTGAKISSGYGHLRQGRSGGTILAHRLSYELFVGPIPDGLCIDHLCRTPACVNPDHLEAVQYAENTRRGDLYAVLAEKAQSRQFCKRGHEFTGRNIYINPNTGDRCCRVCQTLRVDAWRIANRARINELQRRRRRGAFMEGQNA